MTNRQPDASRSRAVIVGVSRYEHHTSLPTVTRNVDDVAELLTGAMWGLDPAHCTVIKDPSHPAEVLDRLAEATAQATDALVFYFAGHGFLLQENFELSLALPGSSRDRWWHAIRYHEIRSIIRAGPGPKAKIVLLDCCFAGAAMSGDMAAKNEISDQLTIEGTYLMTASSATSRAYAPRDEPHTAFTGALLRMARAGIPDGPLLIGLPLLYSRVRGDLAARDRPIPQQRVTNFGGEVALFRNAFYYADRRGSFPPEVPEDLRAAVNSPPVAIGVLLRGYREAGDTDAAGRIHEAIGLTRAEQGVAAVVEQLTADGMSHDAEAVVEAAIRRPLGEVLALVGALQETGQQRWARTLVARSARGEAGRVVDLARRLPDGMRELLVEKALRARLGDSPRLLAMAVALVGVDLAGPTVDALSRMHSDLPADRLAALADGLLAAGHEPAAHQLYDAVPDLVADRSVSAVARLVAGMHRGGRERQALDLVARLAGRHREPQERALLLDALWSLQAPAGPAETLTHLDEDDLLATVHASYAYDLHLPTRRLMIAALAGRPPESTVRFAVALREAGLPLEAQGLIEHAAGGPAERVAAIVAAFAEAGAHEYAARTVRLSFGTALMASLDPRLRHYAEPALAEIPVDERLRLAADLPPEARTRALATLPYDTDPELFHDPPIALAVVNLDEPVRSHLTAALTGRIHWSVAVLDDAVAGAYGEPGACVAHIFALAHVTVRGALAAALAERPAAELVTLLPGGAQAVLEATAAEPATQLAILLQPAPDDDTRTESYRVLLREALTDPHLFAFAEALSRADRPRSAESLIGQPIGSDRRPEAQIASRILGKPSGSPYGEPRARGRAGLQAGTRILRVIRSGVPFWSATAVFTDTELVYVRSIGTRIRIGYDHLAEVHVEYRGPFAVRMHEYGSHYDLEVRADGFADLVVRIHRDLSEFGRFRSRLA